MAFNDEYKILVKNLCLLNRYKAMKLMNKYPNKWWIKIGIKRLPIKFGDTGAVSRLEHSGGPWCAHTEENVNLVNNLVVSRDNMPQTHRTVREILIISWNVMKLPPWVWYSCFLLGNVLICKKMHQIRTFNFLEVVWQHILGVVGGTGSERILNIG